MMSSNTDGNFIARWGVDNIALSWFKDDLPNKMLYKVFASTNRYQIIMVWLWNLSIRTWCIGLCILEYPLFSWETHDLVVVRLDLCLRDLQSFEFLPIQKLTVLPWSTNTFITTKFSTSTTTTMGSSCAG